MYVSVHGKKPYRFPQYTLKQAGFSKGRTLPQKMHGICVYDTMGIWPGRPETMAQLFPKGPEDEYESIRIVEKKRSIGNEALSRVPKTSSCV